MSRLMAWDEPLYGHNNWWLLGWAKSKKGENLLFVRLNYFISRFSLQSNHRWSYINTNYGHSTYAHRYLSCLSAIYAIRFLVNCLTRYAFLPHLLGTE